MKFIHNQTTGAEFTQFAEFVKEHLDGQAYLEAYSDVRSAGLDTFKHWLEHGMVEGWSLFSMETMHGKLRTYNDYILYVRENRWLSS